MKMRLKYVSSPPIQWIFVGVHLVCMFSLFGLCLWFLQTFFNETLSFAIEAGVSKDGVYYQRILAGFERVLNQIVLSLCVFGVLGAAFYIWYSHKIVGPLVSLLAYLDKFQEARKKGELIEPLRFRRGDLLHEVAGKVNQLLGVPDIAGMREKEPAKD